MGVVADIVMLPDPTPTLTMPAPEIVRPLLNVPAELLVVTPVAVINTLDVWTLAEIVIVLAAWPTPIPAPADIDRTPEDPFRLLTTLPGAVWAPEIVRLSPLTPTLILPAPEIFIRPEKVPVLPSVVFPNAVMDCVMVWTLAEIVMVLLAWPVPIPAPAERETLLLVPFRLKFV